MIEKIGIDKLMKGTWQDQITKYDKNGNIVEVVTTPIKNNIIVNTISTLMAGLFTGQYQTDYFFYAIGTGTQGMSINVTGLVAEYTRQQATVGFIDNNNNPSSTPTNRVIIAANWPAGTIATGSNVVILTEFGIFGGTGANAANGGLEVNYVSHSPISIDSSTSISRSVYFTF
jgi:hypothetical protein